MKFLPDEDASTGVYPGVSLDDIAVYIFLRHESKIVDKYTSLSQFTFFEI